MIKLRLSKHKNNGQGDDTAPKCKGNASQSALQHTLALIAKSTQVLAAAAEKPNCEKDWDKAERERKRKHDDRTYLRQGSAYNIARVALGLNFVAIMIAGGSALVARRSSETAHDSVSIASQSLEDTNRYKEIDLEPLPSVVLPDRVEIGPTHPIIISVTNDGTHSFRISKWHVFANFSGSFDFDGHRHSDDKVYKESKYEIAVMPRETNTRSYANPVEYIKDGNTAPIFIAYSIGIKSPTGKIFSREFCKIYERKNDAYQMIPGDCSSYEDMREIN